MRGLRGIAIATISACCWSMGQPASAQPLALDDSSRAAALENQTYNAASFAPAFNEVPPWSEAASTVESLIEPAETHAAHHSSSACAGAGASTTAQSTSPSIVVRGRIHADAIAINQSVRDQEIIGDLENGVGFRRARIGAQGTVGSQVRWVGEFDFAGGEIAFKDVYLGIQDLPLVDRVRVGHMLEPFSLEMQTSSNYITFMERSPGVAIDPARNWGVAFFSYTESQRSTLSAGAFKSGTNIFGDDLGDGNDMAYIARWTALPWYDRPSNGRYLMHVGGAVSQSYPKNDIVTFIQGPQSSLIDFGMDNPLPPFIPDISISATQNQLYNLEWALVLGSLSFQAEWNATNIDQIGGGNVFLHGSYVEASYFLTGESRPYVTTDGTFGMTKVNRPFMCFSGERNFGCGPGAWEVAARFAYLDFSSPNIPLQPDGLKQGNRMAAGTLGINWYLNDYARFMFNYQHVVPVEPNFGPSAAEVFGIRTQIFW